MKDWDFVAQVNRGLRVSMLSVDRRRRRRQIETPLLPKDFR